MSKESWYSRSLQQPRKTQRPEENKKLQQSLHLHFKKQTGLHGTWERPCQL
jgi:hypothetical protein